MPRVIGGRNIHCVNFGLWDDGSVRKIFSEIEEEAISYCLEEGRVHPA
jgi:hypothetical protein